MYFSAQGSPGVNLEKQELQNIFDCCASRTGNSSEKADIFLMFPHDKGPPRPIIMLGPELNSSGRTSSFPSSFFVCFDLRSCANSSLIREASRKTFA